MKKLFALFVTLVILLSFSACNDKTGSDGNSVGGMAGGEMVYTASKCTYTYPSGKESVVYTAELDDSSFIMNNLVERRSDESDRDSMIFDYNGKGITAIRRESQDFEEEIEDGGITTLKYDSDNATLNKETVEDGKTTSKDVYNIIWDSEGRLSSYKLTSYYYEYDDSGAVSYESKYEYNYSYAYDAESFTITCDDKTNEYINEQYQEDIIRRKVTTVPYDEKSDITTVTSYFKSDGTTPVNIDEGDKKLEKEVVVSNRWGYIVSDIYYFTDGSTSNELSEDLTFDSEGRIVKYVTETRKSNEVSKPGEDIEMITVTVDFKYDENGNLTEIKRTADTEVTSFKFEWMQIPKKLDSQIAMFSGSPHWSVAEYIDNFISFNWEGRITVRTYKLDDFLSYIQ